MYRLLNVGLETCGSWPWYREDTILITRGKSKDNPQQQCEVYVRGTVHRNYVSINVQQDATVHSLFYL